jgi:RNA polymerase sigma-70 factor (ECF subfamily)
MANGETASLRRLENDRQDISAVKAVLNGNRRAFESIVNRYTPLLYSLAYQFLGEEYEAEEAVQDIFLKLYKALARFDPSRRFHPWMYTIALNVLRSINKSRRRKILRLRADFDETRPAAGAAGAGDNPLDRVIKQEGERMARKALQALRKEHREVFILRFIEGLPEKEVAEILEMPLGTVKTYGHRARQELAAILTEAGWAG